MAGRLFLTATGKTSQSLKLVVRDLTGKFESETTVEASHSDRYVWKFGKMLHLSWDRFGRKFSHVRCKGMGCNDNRKSNLGTDPSGQFEVATISERINSRLPIWA